MEIMFWTNIITQYLQIRTFAKELPDLMILILFKELVIRIQLRSEISTDCLGNNLGNHCADRAIQKFIET